MSGIGGGDAARVEGLTVRYGRHRALDGVGFAVPKGSIFGLLGENGAGKSTTIGALMGLVVPESGRVATLGLDPAREPLAVRRRVGYVAEQPGMPDWMTVAELGWFASGFRAACPGGSAGFQARYAGLAAEFGLPPARRVRALSKGMRAKVGLALALAPEPELLILDEPTSGLDVLVRREFLESMVGLAGEGRTVILSSHQLGEVERIASHVALIHKGKLILAEPLDALQGRAFVLDLAFEGSGPEAPAAGSGVEVIDAEEGRRQARWLVRGDRRSVEAIRDRPGVAGMEVTSPSLEEIYTAYMRRRPPAAAPSPAAALA